MAVTLLLVRSREWTFTLAAEFCPHPFRRHQSNNFEPEERMKTKTNEASHAQNDRKLWEKPPKKKEKKNGVAI